MWCDTQLDDDSSHSKKRHLKVQRNDGLCHAPATLQNAQARQYQTSYGQAYELMKGARKQLQRSQELFRSAYGEE